MTDRLALAALLLAGCAVPVPPTGGPPDRDPPRIVRSEPADLAVGVATDGVVVEFSEYLNDRAGASAVTITPALDRRPDVSVRGREVRIRFAEPLRDSTTYIITFETSLQDANGVALEAPISLAFSTGAVIDSGTLSGRVRNAIDGAPRQGLDIYAYRLAGELLPDSLPASPDYRTQTDGDGAFRLPYLADAAFLVLGLTDANRSRSVDPGEAVAVPPMAALRPDSAAIGPPWLVSVPDTTGPELRRATALSDSRILLRFSESVVLPDSFLPEVSDSTGRPLEVRRSFVPRDDTRALVLRTEPLPPGVAPYRINPGVQDSTGNAARPSEQTLAVPADRDTVLTRFVGIEADTLQTGLLAPDQLPRFQFSEMPDPDALAAALTASDTSGAQVEVRSASRNGRTINIGPAGPWPAGGLQFRLDLGAFGYPDSVATARFGPAPARLLGEVAGFIDAPDSTDILLELWPENASAPVRTLVGAGPFQFDRLPDGRRYRLRLVEDLDGNGRWTPGQLLPYRPSERLAWFEVPEAVRARWEVVLPDTLRFLELKP